MVLKTSGPLRAYFVVREVVCGAVVLRRASRAEVLIECREAVGAIREGKVDTAIEVGIWNVVDVRTFEGVYWSERRVLAYGPFCPA